MNRRIFLIEAGKAFPVLAGALYLLRCDDTQPVEPAAISVITAESTVSAGHTHVTWIPLEDLDSQAAIDYESFQAEGHTHTVALTGDDFAMLKAGDEVTVSSATTSGHSHDFTFCRESCRTINVSAGTNVRCAEQ